MLLGLMIALLYLFMVPENVKIPCVVLYSYTAPGECTKSSFALLIRATQFLFFFKCQELIKHSLNTFHKDYEDINSLYTWIKRKMLWYISCISLHHKIVLFANINNGTLTITRRRRKNNGIIKLEEKGFHFKAKVFSC